MLTKKEIEHLRHIVRDGNFSAQERLAAFRKLLQEEASVLEADFREYDAAAILAFDDTEVDADKERLYNSIAEKLQLSTPHTNNLPRNNRGLLLRVARFAGGVAAVMLLAVALLVLYRQSMPLKQGDQFLAVQTQTAPEQLNGFDTLQNNLKNFQNFVLPDGSRVALAPASYVCYRKDFAVRNKVVYLHGEGRFTVHKKEDMPFSVYVNDIEVRDLGTVFHITSAGNRLKVLLVKGKVLVHSLKRSVAIPDIALVPGQQLDVNMLSGRYSLHQPQSVTDVAADTAAPDFNEMLLAKALEFDNTPVEEVLQTLQQEFHVHIAIKNHTKEGLLFTGRFTEYMSLSQILNVISRSYNLHISHKGTSIVLKPNSK